LLDETLVRYRYASEGGHPAAPTRAAPADAMVPHVAAAAKVLWQASGRIGAHRLHAFVPELLDRLVQCGERLPPRDFAHEHRGDDRHTAGSRPAWLTLVASGSYHMDMRAVGLKILKNRLSEYVRLAASGETVLITDRDRVVAELVPPQGGRALHGADALLADAVRRGWMTPPLLPAAEVPPRAPVTTLKVLLKELAQDRADR
jgi:antitoxin (DNA-binding transcriptional repressor) of toxin-antitoxin stability system